MTGAMSNPPKLASDSSTHADAPRVLGFDPFATLADWLGLGAGEAPFDLVDFAILVEIEALVVIPVIAFPDVAQGVAIADDAE